MALWPPLSWGSQSLDHAGEFSQEVEQHRSYI